MKIGRYSMDNNYTLRKRLRSLYYQWVFQLLASSAPDPPRRLRTWAIGAGQKAKAVSKFLYIPQYSWLLPNKLPFPCRDWFTGFCVECMPAPSIGIPILVNVTRSYS